MRVYTFQHSQTVSSPLQEVFGFFSRPENLERITPSQLRFETLTPPPIAMREGALIDYALTIKGVPVHWRSLITCYDPPNRFVDEQLKGPYAFWHHEHRFEAVPGGTRIDDEVRYALPLGALGALAHRLFVRRDVERIFHHRETVIAEQFGPPPDGAASGRGH
jgi:hypothetical protein